MTGRGKPIRASRRFHVRSAYATRYAVGGATHRKLDSLIIYRPSRWNQRGVCFTLTSLQLAVSHEDVAVRQAAAALARRMSSWLPEGTELRPQLDMILNEFGAGICYSVRTVSLEMAEASPEQCE